MYRYTKQIPVEDKSLSDDVKSLFGEELLFPDTQKVYDYVIHEYTIDDVKRYDLSINTEEDSLQFLSFPGTGNMDAISDSPNVTRLFGEMSEDTREGAWLTYETETESNLGQNPGIYKIFDSGKVKFGEQNEKFSELFFNGKVLHDRWLLRVVPNVLDKSLFSDEKILVFWKPAEQLSYDQAFSANKEYKTIQCECPVKKSSAHFHDLVKEEGEELLSKMSTDVIFNPDTHTFEGVGSAEGTWIDMFGEKYTYTPEFITHSYNKQRDALARGEKIMVGTEHQSLLGFHGEVTDIQLFQQPIYHIRVKGIYTGPVDIQNENYGLSYEFRLRSVWNSEFQTWVPFDSTTDRIDVVRRPACKICWINKVK